MAVGKHEIVWPAAGLNKAAGFERQPPFSTRRAKNVVAFDPFHEARRGGPRWGLDRSFRYNQVNGTNPVRLLANVDIVDPNNQTFWEDTFVASSLGGLWTQLTITGGAGLTAVTGVPSLDRGLAYVEGTGASTAVHKAAWLTSPSPWSIGSDSDDTYEYRVEVFVVPNRGTTASTSKVEIFLRLDDASPDYGVEGIRVALGFSDGVGGYGGNVTVRQGSAQTAQQAFATGNTQDTASNNVAMPGWFSVRLRRHGTSGGFIDVYWRGIELLANYNIPGSWSATGDRVVGFGLEAAGSANRISIDTFRLSYRTSSETNRSILVASSGSTSSDGNLVREAKLNDYSELGANKLAGDRSLMAAQRGQVLYIADHGPIIASAQHNSVSRTVNVWSDLNYTYLRDNAAPWALLGLPGTADAVNMAYVRLLDLDQYPNEYTFRILEIAPDIGGGADPSLLKLELVPGFGGSSSGSADPCYYRVQRPPKEYDVQNASVNFWGVRNSGLPNYSNVGAIPLGCSIISAWQDRCIMAGAVSEPSVIRASRVGDWHDWDTAADPADESRAWSLTTDANALAGIPGKLTTALIPFSNDYLVISVRDELIQLRGSPTRGAFPDALSRTIGIVDKFAWCMPTEGEAVAISPNDGLFLIPGNGASPSDLSKGVLPQELRGLNKDVHNVMLGYDRRMNGVFIFVSPHGQHFFFDWRDKTFWPVELPANFEPYAIVQHQSQSASESGLYLGCKDGYIRRFHPQHHREDVHNMNSEVLIGPIMLGRGTDDFGILAELLARLAKDSASVRWSLHVGATVEDALVKADANTAIHSGTFSQAGLTSRSHPRSSGRYCFIKIRDNGGIVYRPWAFESLMVDIEAAGLQRV